MGGIYTNTFHDAVTHLVAKVRHSSTYHVIKSVSYLAFRASANFFFCRACDLKSTRLQWRRTYRWWQRSGWAWFGRRARKRTFTQQTHNSRNTSALHSWESPSLSRRYPPQYFLSVYTRLFLTLTAEKTKTQGKTQHLGEFSLQARKLKKETKKSFSLKLKIFEGVALFMPILLQIFFKKWKLESHFKDIRKKLGKSKKKTQDKTQNSRK